MLSGGAGSGALAALDRRAGWLADRLLTGRAFVPAILGYMLLLYAIRGLLFPGGMNDDSEQLLYSQTLQLTYGIKNPPLYTWLIGGLIALFGPSLATVVALKIVLLAGIYLLYHAAARLMACDERWAVAAAASPLTLYYVAWDAVRSYSHSILVVFFCVATFACLLHLVRSGRLGWYLLFGLVMALGAMAKYNYLLFLACLLAASLLDPGFRRRLLDWRMAAALTVALVVLAPHAVAALAQIGGAPALVSDKFALGQGTSFLAGAASGLGSAANALGGMLSPFLIFLPLFFLPAFRPLPAPEPDQAAKLAAVGVAGRALLIQGGVIVLMILAAGATTMNPHLFFIFILFPLWFVTRASFAAIAPRALDRFAALVVALALTVPLVMLIKFATDPLKESRRPYLNVPYPALVAELKAAGFEAGTVFAMDYPYPLSGILRAYLPESRFLSDKFAYIDPPERVARGQCLAIWEADRVADIDAQAAAAFAARVGGGVDILAEAKLIDLPMVNGWGRRARFKYWLAPDGLGTCH